MAAGKALSCGNGTQQVREIHELAITKELHLRISDTQCHPRGQTGQVSDGRKKLLAAGHHCFLVFAKTHSSIASLSSDLDELEQHIQYVAMTRLQGQVITLFPSVGARLQNCVPSI